MLSHKSPELILIGVLFMVFRLIGNVSDCCVDV